MRAARFAWRDGKDLTRFAVMHIPAGPVGDELVPQRLFANIRTRCRSWWDYRRMKDPSLGPMTDVRTWENKNGVLHVNWLVRVPKHLEADFDAMVNRRMTKVLIKRAPGDLNIGPITNLNGVLRYILKGTDKNKASVFDIRPEDQGVVWGRRAVASINLGRAARDRGWQAGTVANKAWKYRKPSPHA